MTNEQIIMSAKAQLVANGKIGADDEIHTYKHWKRLGFQVFRGEKAIIALNIWQHSGKQEKAEDDEEKKPTGRMYMRRASFFSSQQVFSLADE